MRYYLISTKSDNNVAVVFHNTVESSYVIRSKSEAFRRAFESANKSIDIGILVKEKNSVVFRRLSLDNPYWMSKVLEKACGNYWVVKQSSDISYDVQIDEIVSKFLY